MNSMHIARVSVSHSLAAGEVAQDRVCENVSALVSHARGVVPYSHDKTLNEKAQREFE
jgi:hypothetical protein